MKFTVDVNGNIKDIKVLRSPDEAMSKEAVRLLRNIPKWKPAEIEGKKTDMQFVMPITFRFK